jgi:hypothetical protein
MMVCVPIPAEADTRAGPRRCCYVWYRPADYETELPVLCTDASGRRHGHSIPPTLIRREVIDDIKASAARLFPPVIAGIVARVVGRCCRLSSIWKRRASCSAAWRSSVMPLLLRDRT